MLERILSPFQLLGSEAFIEPPPSLFGFLANHDVALRVDTV